jgi:hypothetical protein
MLADAEVAIPLQRLSQMLKRKEPDVGDAALVISGLPIAQRKAAGRSELMAGLLEKLSKPDADRLRVGLGSLVSDTYAGFLAAVRLGQPEDIKSAYGAMSADDRRDIATNAGALHTISKTTDNPALLACVHAMSSTMRPSQYDAMAAFLAALSQAQADLVTAPTSGVPDYVTAALSKLNDTARWTFLSWSEEAVKQYVDVLPTAVARAVRERLRD